MTAAGSKKTVGLKADSISGSSSPQGGGGGLYVAYFEGFATPDGRTKVSRLDTTTPTLSVASTFTGLGPLNPLPPKNDYKRLNEQLDEILFLNGTLVIFGEDRVANLGGPGFFVGDLPAPWSNNMRYHYFTDPLALTGESEVVIENYTSNDLVGNVASAAAITDGTDIYHGFSGFHNPANPSHFYWDGIQAVNPQTGQFDGAITDPGFPIQNATPHNYNLRYFDGFWYARFHKDIYKGDRSSMSLLISTFGPGRSSNLNNFNINASTGELFLAGTDYDTGFPAIFRYDNSGTYIQTYLLNSTDFTVATYDSYANACCAAGDKLYASGYLTNDIFSTTFPMLDSSGNGYDSNYSASGFTYPTVTGYLPGSHMLNADSTVSHSARANPGAPFTWISSLTAQESTIDAWVVPTAGYYFSLAGHISSSSWCYFDPSAQNFALLTTTTDGLYSASSANGSVPFDGSAHHIAIVWTAALTGGTNTHLYVDGVNKTITESGTGLAVTTNAQLIGVSGTFPPSSVSKCKIGQIAYYNSALSAGTIATHAATTSSLSAYTSVVLASSPVMYYEMNETGTVPHPEEVPDPIWDIDIAAGTGVDQYAMRLGVDVSDLYGTNAVTQLQIGGNPQGRATGTAGTPKVGTKTRVQGVR